MNARGVLDQLMSAAGGRGGAAGQGGDVGRLLEGLASQFGGLSASPGSGSSPPSGVDMKSLLGGGAIGLLIGSKRGRKMGGKALKYGAIAGLGVLAYKAWQNYKGTDAEATAGGERVDRLQGQDRERRSLEILQAMIMAARADGHIDDNERLLLTEQIDALGADTELHQWVERQIQAPLDAETLAQQADSPQAAREMYLVSAAIVDDQNAMERAWLEELARALKLEPALTVELERQVTEGARAAAT